jgi:hypothetical protein
LKVEQTWLEILRQEFVEGEDSFCLQLRINLAWDKKAFSRLTAAMLQCCKSMAQDEMLPRWLAEGFWYIPQFVRNWTTHPAWKETTQTEPQYYEDAYQRLDDLAYWFFIGESSYIDPEKGYAPM